MTEDFRSSGGAGHTGEKKKARNNAMGRKVQVNESKPIQSKRKLRGAVGLLYVYKLSFVSPLFFRDASLVQVATADKKYSGRC